MTKSEDKVNEEDVKVKAALDKASEAQSKSSEGYDKVQKALSTIRDIALALNNLDTISKLICL
jgi:methyl-accepting chemotaxis protein